MTARIALHQTLSALIDGVTPDHPELAIEEAEINLPLQVWLEHGAEGPVLTAHPPHSAYLSGVNPVVHRTRIRIEAADPKGSGLAESPTPAWPGASA